MYETQCHKPDLELGLIRAASFGVKSVYIITDCDLINT